ncbi:MULTISPECIES: ATP phosphoribosyltransferase regulatory subunit [unclassified Caulobacter]|uniref:ATP phosphoribosyltransferase regulatory subunit n=1 Tax=unclassified Caulobacter TaxID=2648921 RepID=UPI0006F51A0D|nr:MULTISPECIES: ATP phosphoribosyltransferase regulatory subunit [unclassified Caulobacter]KQV62431.1 ATP phosphoribosyltransferase regulatory subunit [Caulobacter sp. Root342]KQV65559.1 ATP phosphoribosyltransferase regulatory subunit [Caulobacter sp. Root343]
MRLERSIPAEALDAIRAPLLAAGAAPTDAPVLQPLGLLLDLAGEAMRSRLFVVSGDGGEEACLRPDFTVAVAREHFASGLESGRYRYEGKAFRVAPRGSDRAEEFLQLGVEAFEAGDPVAADAEIAALAWASSAAGGRADLSLVLGDVSLFAAFIDSLDLAAPLAARLKRAFAKPRQLKAELDGEAAAPLSGEQSRIATLLAGLPEAEASAVLQELWSLAGIEPVGGRRPAEIAHRLVEKAEAAQAGRLNPEQAEKVRAFLAVSDRPDAALDAIAALAGPNDAALTAAVAGWRSRLSGMAARGVPLDKATLAAAFGRAFGYYDGFLFEVRSLALGAERPLAAGGRYDGLPARLGVSTNTGAVGCMVRPARAYAGGGE